MKVQATRLFYRLKPSLESANLGKFIYMSHNLKLTPPMHEVGNLQVSTTDLHTVHTDLSNGKKETTATAYSESYLDRKSTRLNSSHVSISYAVFCLKKKKRN